MARSSRAGGAVRAISERCRGFDIEIKLPDYSHSGQAGVTLKGNLGPQAHNAVSIGVGGRQDVRAANRLTKNDQFGRAQSAGQHADHLSRDFLADAAVPTATD